MKDLSSIASLICLTLAALFAGCDSVPAVDVLPSDVPSDIAVPEALPPPPTDLPLQDPRPGQPLPFLNIDEFTIYGRFLKSNQAQIGTALVDELQRIEDSFDPRLSPGVLTRRLCTARRAAVELSDDAVIDAYQRFEAITGFPTTTAQALEVLAEAQRELNLRRSQLASSFPECNR